MSLIYYKNSSQSVIIAYFHVRKLVNITFAISWDSPTSCSPAVSSLYYIICVVVWCLWKSCFHSWHYKVILATLAGWLRH